MWSRTPEQHLRRLWHRLGVAQLSVTTRPRIGCVRVFDVETEAGPAAAHVLVFEDLPRARVADAVRALERSSAVAAECGASTRLVRPRAGLVANLVDPPSEVSLATWLEREPRLPLFEAHLVLRDLAACLARTHAAGSVDGALTAQRVWWEPPHARWELPGAGSIGGTTAMPPDDVLGFGRLAFRTLFGREPAEPEPTPLAALRPHLPAGLAHLLTRCLAADPTARPTAADLDCFFRLLAVPPPSARDRHRAAEAAFRARRGEG